MTSTDRYKGAPLLRLLECYVLWAIGRLDEKHAGALEAMTPKLCATYGVQGDWQTVIAAATRLPPNMPELIRDLWNRNLELAKQHRVTIDPQHFAEKFVDDNLV